jgi:hypothetical protein
MTHKRASPTDRKPAMTVQVATTVDTPSLPVAAKLLGISGAGNAAIVRAALALYHGHSMADAAKYAVPDADTDNRRTRIVAKIPDDLPIPESPAWAIRVGIGLAMGLRRKDAEYWASTVERGRPKQSAA